MGNNVLQEIMRFQKERDLHNKGFVWANEAKNVLEEIFEAEGYDIPKHQRSMIFNPVLAHAEALINMSVNTAQTVPTNDDRVDAFADIVVFAIGAMMKLGYDPEKVLGEVGKEINSREGEMMNGKFEKYLDDAHKAKWYKADFTECRL